MQSIATQQEADRSGLRDAADIHLHSCYSDGVHSPAELVKKASGAGLKAISITDHDSISGIEEGRSYGKECGVNVISGIELSSTVNGREVHLLGYFFDITNSAILAGVKFLKEQRLIRADRIVKKLNRLNIPIAIDSVLSLSAAGSIGRPHIARALVDGGYIASYFEAFSRFLGEGLPAYEPKVGFSPQEIVSLIANAGGLSILAHPGKTVVERDILSLIQAGIDGIEVVHPSHTPDLVRYYRAIVNQYYLVESGGSDFHGGPREDDDNFGRVTIPMGTIANMHRRIPLQYQQNNLL